MTRISRMPVLTVAAARPGPGPGAAAEVGRAPAEEERWAEGRML